MHLRHPKYNETLTLVRPSVLQISFLPTPSGTVPARHLELPELSHVTVFNIIMASPREIIADITNTAWPRGRASSHVLRSLCSLFSSLVLSSRTSNYLQPSLDISKGFNLADRSRSSAEICFELTVHCFESTCFEHFGASFRRICRVSFLKFLEVQFYLCVGVSYLLRYCVSLLMYLQILKLALDIELRI